MRHLFRQQNGITLTAFTPRTNRTIEIYRRQFGTEIQNPNLRVLDVGGGDARWTPRAGESQVVRTDIDYVNCPRGSANAVGANVLQLPLAAECFDLVVCSWMMPYTASSVIALQEVVRVTRCGGRVMIHPTFHVLTRFVQCVPVGVRAIVSRERGARPTLVIEKVAGLSERDWDSLTVSIAESVKLAPSRATTAFRRCYHDVLVTRIGSQMDRRASQPHGPIFGRSSPDGGTRPDRRLLEEHG